MPVEGRSMHLEMMDNATCPYHIPGNEELQNNYLSTQGEKTNFTNCPKGRSKADLKYLHIFCGEMTEHFLQSSEEKTTEQRTGTSGELSFKYEDNT